MGLLTTYFFGIANISNWCTFSPRGRWCDLYNVIWYITV